MDDKLLLEAIRTYAGEEILNNILEKGASALERNLTRVDVTIMTIDLDSFTPNSVPKNLTNDQLLDTLNDYLDTIAFLITKYGGMIGHVTGNAFMAYWFNESDSTSRSVRCAIDCVETTATISKVDGLTLSARIGIVSGGVVLGNMGPKTRLHYTIMGNNVNLAWRLQAVNSEYRTQILICGNTAKMIDKNISKELVNKIIVVGNPEPIALYKIVIEK